MCIQSLFYIYTVAFLSDPGIPGPIYGSGLSHSVRHLVADLTDVTLVDEDTKSILSDNANKAIQGNQAMHETLSGVQIC